MQEENNTLASLPVRLVFQTGQAEVPLSDIEQLAPGAVLPIDRTINDIFDVVVNGTIIGRAGLVQTDDGLAVRVIRLNSDG